MMQVIKGHVYDPILSHEVWVCWESCSLQQAPAILKFVCRLRAITLVNIP